MITLANIRRAIYNIGKRLDILEKNGGGSGNGFSGDYNDLSNKPVIPDALIQSDWNQSDNTQVDYIKNKPTVLNGTDGKSAYQSYLDTTTDNPVLSESDWVASLHGADGTNGTDGQNGTNGTDGVTPTVNVTNIAGGHNVEFSYGSGDNRNTNFNVMDGINPSGAVISTTILNIEVVLSLPASPDANTIYIVQ